MRETNIREQTFTIAGFWPILWKNSVGELTRATLRKPTFQIGPGSTIAISPRVE
jgi:hypothetical protein